MALDSEDTEQRQLSEILTPQLLSDIRRIELRTKKRVSTDVMGSYRSAFRGSGLIFSDLREYGPGDDVKKIHWKATARSARPYVKDFEEDRQLQIILAVDTSRSILSGTPLPRSRTALEFTALISLMATRGHDRVGLCLFSDDLEEFLPPRQQRSAVQQILMKLLRKRDHRSATDIGKSLESLLKFQRRSSVIFVVSDFFSPPFERQLRPLAARHDVVLVCLEGANDEAIPNVGLVEFQDAESGNRVVIDTSSKSVRKAVQQMRKDRVEALRGIAANCGADVVFVGDNAFQPLSELMRLRTSRVR